MKKENIQEKVDELGSLQAWNHNFVLPHNVETRPGDQVSHGKNLIKLNRLIPLFEDIGLKGKSVLDVGCNEAFLTTYGKRGAKVHGIDIDEKGYKGLLHKNSSSR